MRLRFAINLLLLTFVVGTALFLIRTKSEQKDDTPDTISPIETGEISNIIIKRKDKETIHFIKEEFYWKMQTPFQAATSQQRIDVILTLLKAEGTDQFVAENNDLARFGLENPKITLILNNEIFTFGKVNPLNKKRYVSYNKTIHLIHDNLYPQLAARPTFFIDKKVIPLGLDIRNVQYAQYQLLKQGETWRLESALTIDEEKVQSLGKIWQNMNASSVQEYMPMEHLYEIRVGFDDETFINYTVVSDLPDLVLARPDLGVQYHIPRYLAEKLFPREEPRSIIGE